MSYQKSARIFCGFLVLIVIGCSGDGFKGARGSVSGRITIGGKPIPAGSQIMFIAAEGSYVAFGQVKADGKYAMKYRRGSNMPAVKYTATLSAPVSAKTEGNSKTASKTAPDPSAAMSQFLKAKADKTEKKVTIDEGPIPSKYASTNTSKLVCTVLAGANTVNFDLDP